MNPEIVFGQLPRFYPYAIGGSLLLVAGTLLIGFLRFLKFRVKDEVKDPEKENEKFFPVMNPKTYLPKGWTLKKDAKVLKKALKNDQLYVGWERTKGLFGAKAIPILLPMSDLLGNTQGCGSTGFGKTVFMVNTMYQYLLRGTGAIFIDPKGDDETLKEFLAFADYLGLMDKVHFFSLAYPKISQVYNPISYGTPEEITETIINSCEIENEYYKKIQFVFLLNTIRILKSIHQTINLLQVVGFLKNFKDEDWVRENITDKTTKDLSPLLRETVKKDYGDISGLEADLSLLAEGEFSPIINGENEIDLKKIINNGEIAIFQFPTMLLGTIGKSMGTMILQGIQSVVGRRQFTERDPDFTKKNVFPIFVDEFYSLAYPNFMEMINKCRSSKNPFFLGHQGLSDLESVSETFKRGVFQNTNCKFVCKMVDPDDAENFVKSWATYTKVKETQAVEKGLFFNRSNKSSFRESEAYIVHPNRLKFAKTGQGVVRGRTGKAKCCHFRLYQLHDDIKKRKLQNDLFLRIPKRGRRLK